MLKKNLVVCAALLTAVVSLSAFQAKPADLTGTWTGTLSPEGGNQAGAHLVLKQKGAELTGTAGPDVDRQSEIKNGKVATVKGVTSVTFQVPQPNGPVMNFDLKLTEGRLKGPVVADMPDGSKRNATVDVGRAK